MNEVILSILKYAGIPARNIVRRTLNTAACTRRWEINDAEYVIEVSPHGLLGVVIAGRNLCSFGHNVDSLGEYLRARV